MSYENKVPGRLTGTPAGSDVVGFTTLSGNMELPLKATFTELISALNLTPATMSVTYLVSAAANAKLGGSGAGWVIEADDAKPLVTLPASQTAEVLLIPLDGFYIGDVVTAVGVNGQVESGGNNVTVAMDLRKTTGAAAGHADASIATDNVGTLTADTLLSVSNLGTTGLSETIDATKQLYVTLTATTGASCDIELYSLSVTVTRAIR